MANFIGFVQGNRGEVSRVGAKEIRSNIRGWNTGVHIAGYKEKEENVFYISLTGDSNNPSKYRILTLTEKEIQDIISNRTELIIKTKKKRK